jgi:hypothetical protein
MLPLEEESGMPVDQAKRKEAIERFVAITGATEKEAASLVDAALDGIVDQALETITGLGPVATSMTDLKADQIRFACLRAGRMLKQREVEALFRIKPSAARAILGNMQAVYGRALRQQALAEMREDASVTPGGTADTGLTWKIKFSERATYDTAVSELARLRLLDATDERATQRTLEIAQRVKRGSASIDPLEALGIPHP